MKIRNLGYVAGFILLAAGISAIAEESKIKPLSEKEYQELTLGFDKGKDCIFSRTVNNWASLTKDSLILYAPTKSKPYYVSLTRRVLQLNFAHTIGVYSKFDNRFCPYGGNALFIDGERYTIKAIKKIDKITAKQLIAYHKNKK